MPRKPTYRSGQTPRVGDIVWPAEAGLRQVAHLVTAVEISSGSMTHDTIVSVVEFGKWHYASEGAYVFANTLSLIKRKELALEVMSSGD